MTAATLPLNQADFDRQVEFRLLKTRLAAAIAPASLARAVCNHMQEIANTDLAKALYFAHVMVGDRR